MRLSELMAEDGGNFSIAPPGDLFAALPGTRTDGKHFVPDAVARGATVILTDDPKSYDALTERAPPVTIVGEANPRRRFARIAARFYAPQPRTMVAVTGTNGKTSVTVFTRQIWRKLGWAAASFGTIGIVAPGFARPGALTTPDPVTLHSELNALAQTGVDHVAIEASSHGLDQFRLDGLALQAAAFTNLTRDHLDYHGTMDAYRAAKERLFTEILPRTGAAVINLDDEAGRALADVSRARGQRVIGYGKSTQAELRFLDARPAAFGQHLKLSAFGVVEELLLPLIGDFQGLNALAALGLAVATGADVRKAIRSLGSLEGAPGRMERVATHPSGAPVLVDYAHTPDALENALRALRAQCRGRIVVVFGAGGDRDPGKRPAMGAIAAKLADVAIVTDDNPRREDPALIRRAVLAACPSGIEIGDRAAAIRRGLELLRGDDLLLIAGKGHETGQIVGATTLPFSDAEVARAALRQLGSAA